MAYDSARGVTVLLGGTSESNVLGDTWKWDGSTWTPRSTAGSTVKGHPLNGNKCSRGTLLAGHAEKMRPLLPQTCEKRIGEVLDVLFDLAINER